MGKGDNGCHQSVGRPHMMTVRSRIVYETEKKSQFCACRSICGLTAKPKAGALISAGFCCCSFCFILNLLQV